jgi:hypothetical protein
MKKIRIVQAVLLVAVVAVITSCSSSRNSYANPYPPRQTSFSLILHSSPGMVVNRYHDGRYYHRTPQGYTYWRGNDNRYYLDRSYLNRGRYDRGQYKSWKNGHKGYYRKNHRR